MTRFLQPASLESNPYRVKATDLIVALVTPFAAFWVREPTLFSSEGISAVLIYAAIAFVTTSIAVAYFRLGDILSLYISIHDGEQILRACLLSVIGTSLLGFIISRLDSVPRSIPVIHFMLLFVGLAGVRYVRRALLRKQERTSASPTETEKENLIIIGANQFAWFYVRIVDAFCKDTQRIIAILDPNPRLIGRTVSGHRVVGSPGRLDAVLAEYEVHGVFVRKVVVADLNERELEPLIADIERVCKERGIRLEFIAERLGLILPSDIMSLPNTLISTSPNAGYAYVLSFYWKVKRAIDVVIAAAALPVAAPLILLTAILVLIDCGLPLVFWQERLGKDNKPFAIYKFRTFRPPYDRYARPISNSHRLSKFGGFLRAVRLDELPQLYNILIGDMSVIGPRPLLPVDQPEKPSIRLAVRPGLTGWAQVHGGKLITAEEKNALDEWYIRHVSFALDVNIILATIATVIRGDRRNEVIVKAALEEQNEHSNSQQ
jgi:lipopolysaccharide/colanic/teichoic acid biosynthesis glycosyltransferase